ncbi:MAG: PIG-L family deacetylase [Candidatus Levybacteria bacterium]|nr:PIG-L family deacetylase [Candidatus Levybacteria bacterium]
MKQKNVLLAVGAHPDDLEFTSSGTIARMVDEGWDAYYLLCTDGSRGSKDPKMTHKRLAQIRRKEQVKAGKILGLKDIFFLNHTDTELVTDMTLKGEIVRIIRTVRPKIVFGWDPTFYYTEHSAWTDTAFINHTDHRAAGIATMDAVFPLSRDMLTFPEQLKEGLSAHRVEELWLYGAEKKAHVVNITSTFDKKIKALEVHASQFDDFPAIKKRVVNRALNFAEEEEFEFAESFIRLILP